MKIIRWTAVILTCSACRYETAAPRAITSIRRKAPGRRLSTAPVANRLPLSLQRFACMQAISPSCPTCTCRTDTSCPGKRERERGEACPDGVCVRRRREGSDRPPSCQACRSSRHDSEVKAKPFVRSIRTCVGPAPRHTCGSADKGGEELAERRERGHWREPFIDCRGPSGMRGTGFKRRGWVWLRGAMMGWVAVLALAWLPGVEGRKWWVQWKDVSAELPRCRGEEDCGARQECLSGICMCPVQWGIVDMPHCVTNTSGTWVLLAFVHLLSALLLVLGYLHIRTLHEHLSFTEPPAPAGSRRPSSPPVRPMLPGFGVGKTHPGPLPPAEGPSPQTGGSQGSASAALHRLMSYKSLFCLFSLLFVGLSLARNVSMTLFVLDPTVRITDVLTGPYSVVAVGVGVGLTALTWAYLLVARIWLGLAAHFHSPWLSRFAGSQSSLVVLFVPGVLAAVPPIMIFQTNQLVARYLTYMSSMAVIGLVATGFMALGSAVMVPALKERAERVRALRMAAQQGTAGVVEEEGGDLNDDYSPEDPTARGPKSLRQLESEAHRERRSIVRLLRRKRRQLFLPSLDRISEAEKSALERSSSLSIISGGRHSSLDATGSLRPNLAEADGPPPPSLQLQMVMQWVDSSAPKVAGSPSPRPQVLPRIDSGDEAIAQRRRQSPRSSPRTSVVTGPDHDDNSHPGHASAAGLQSPTGASPVTRQQQRPSLASPLGKGDDTARFDALPTAIARTASRIGQMNLLCFVCNLAQFFILKKTLIYQRTEGAVLATMVGLVGFPAAHIYANIVCLVAISVPAREGLESIQLLLYRLLDGFLLLLIALFGCGLDSIDLQRELGVQSGSGSADYDA